MQWLDNGSRLDPRIHRRRLLTIATDRVWGEAPGSYLLAILIPLLSIPRFSASLTPGTCPLHCHCVDVSKMSIMMSSGVLWIPSSPYPSRQHWDRVVL